MIDTPDQLAASAAPGTSGPLAVSRVATPEALDALRGEWTALLDRSPARSFFLSHEWVSAWWRHFGRGRDLWVRVLRDGGGALRAVAPLFRETVPGRLGAYRRVGFLGVGGAANPDHLDLVVEAGWERSALEAFLDDLLADRGEWDLLDLTDVREESATPGLLAEQAGRRGLRVHRHVRTVCPYLKLPPTWDDLMASLSPNMRRDVRKAEKLARTHALEILSYEEPGRVDEGLAELGRLHQMRMEESRRGGNFRKEDYTAFHREVMGLCAERGWLELKVLRLDGVSVAANYAFRHAGVFYGYQMGLHPDYYRHSLGTVLLGICARGAIEAGLREFDFLRGRSAWKYRWTDTDRVCLGLTLESPGWRGRRARWSSSLSGRPGLVLKKLLPRAAFEGIQDRWRRWAGRGEKGRRAS